MDGSDMQKARTNAYRAYLRSMKESLANMDVEAVDLTKTSATVQPILNCYPCYPCGPCGPCIPCWPCYPCHPCHPCYPCGPCIAQ
jgi:hypothetical protein